MTRQAVRYLSDGDDDMDAAAITDLLVRRALSPYGQRPPARWTVTQDQANMLRGKMHRAQQEMSMWFEDTKTYMFISEGWMWLARGLEIEVKPF